MAAFVGARLASHLEKSLAPKNVTFWSDSQIVLQWLQSTKPLKRFQANRVKEIQEITHDRKWMFCPTADNPADLLTRGISAAQYKNNRLWREGPDWLLDTYKWPTWDINNTAVRLTTDDDEIPFALTLTEQNPILTVIHSVVDITRYSRQTKLIRVTAFILRFVNNCRCPHNRKLSRLSVHELQEAEKMWLRSCQSTSYPKEIDNLQSKKGRLPMVKHLRLFLDSDGCIRCCGRIHNAPVAELAKFPYLLPGKHHLTRLIIQDTHERLLHAGISATVTQLRQKYWIVHQNRL